LDNSSTVSSFTRVWCSLQDVLTSPVWKASWLLSAPTLSSNTTPLATPPPICLGGSMSSDPQRSLVPSQAQPSSQTETPFQTPAQVLVSALLSATNGEHGVSSQGGRQMVGTSGGQRPSASSSSLDLSVQRAYQVSFSKSLVTTAASSRAGGREGAETGKPTGSSGASMTSRLLTDALLSHATLPVVKTQQMAPPEDSTLRLLVSSQHAVSPTLSGNLSSILTTNPSPPDMGLDWAGLSIAASPIAASPTHRVSHSTNPRCLVEPQPITPAVRLRPSKPSAYQPSISPIPSPLRPHCLAQDRLRLWIPSPSVTSRHSAPQEVELSRIFDVMSNAWASSRGLALPANPTAPGF